VRTGEAVVRSVHAAAYRIPTSQPEADGTFAWDSTTIVIVEVASSDGAAGLGYSYTTAAAAYLINAELAGVVEGTPVSEPRAARRKMVDYVRNIGRAGIASTAIAAVDVALWDLAARSALLPLYQLLGARRTQVPAYGSGGFTSYDDRTLAAQLGGWAEQGLAMVKMKIGTNWGANPEEDVRRVRVAHHAIGASTQLFVDANGAYTAKQAIAQAERFANYDVRYFEEPVSSDHLAEMAFVRARTSMDIAAGEYGYDEFYFRRMLESGAVDILQADGTRCGGITGFLQAGDLAEAAAARFSAHTAPSIHAHAACAVPQISHVEYFYDHARIEEMLFDGAATPVGGCLRPDPSRPGLGLELKKKEAEKWLL
jgi:L-alanine-DL-glutamate epimerase-like enolase superfamily enzyme